MMNEKLKRIGIKIVGFKVGVDRAVFYRRLNTPNDRTFGEWMNCAFHQKGCDFVSVRKIDLGKHER